MVWLFSLFLLHLQQVKIDLVHVVHQLELHRHLRHLVTIADPIKRQCCQKDFQNYKIIRNIRIFCRVALSFLPKLFSKQLSSRDLNPKPPQFLVLPYFHCLSRSMEKKQFSFFFFFDLSFWIHIFLVILYSEFLSVLPHALFPGLLYKLDADTQRFFCRLECDSQRLHMTLRQQNYNYFEESPRRTSPGI